jgi:hypothetical protein
MKNQTSNTKMGRPTTFTLEVADEICNKIAANTKGVKRLSNENPHWPNQDTIFTWLRTRPDFSEQYARAKRCQAEMIIEEIIDIADDNALDISDSDDCKVINYEHISRSRLRIDTRKWLASKLIPKIYGDRPEDQTEATGQICHICKNKSNEAKITVELARQRIAEMLNKPLKVADNINAFTNSQEN